MQETVDSNCQFHQEFERFGYERQQVPVGTAAGGSGSNGSSSLNGLNGSNGSNGGNFEPSEAIEPIELLEQPQALNQASAIEPIEPQPLNQAKAIEPFEPIEPQRQSMAQWAEGMGISVMSNTEIQHVLNRCGLMGLAGAVMYVLREVLAMPSEYMICEPDEKRGKHLLDEIMIAGNFGKYDPRKGDLSHESSAHKFLRKTKRNLLLAKYYPHEALCEPFFRVYHWLWRKLELWKTL